MKNIPTDLDNEECDVLIAEDDSLYDDDEYDDDDNATKSPIFKEFLSWALTIAIALFAAWFINNCIIVNATIPTGSMENTIMPNDRIVAFRLSYVSSEPERGDIIVFKYPDDKNVLYVKRIVGLPGDIIDIVGGDVFLNDNEFPLDEPFVKGDPSGYFGPYTVPENSYFVLGDNRNNSSDSRFWQNTFVVEEDILGKAYFKYYPKIELFE